MFNQSYPTHKILQQLERKLRNGEIIFWIDKEQCYLLANNIQLNNQIKVGDLTNNISNYHYSKKY